MPYTWDPKKAARNLKEHGISFEEAETACEEPLAKWEPDRGHYREERMNVYAMSPRHRVLFVVCIVYDDSDDPHIISARKATAHERKIYESSAF